MFTKRLLLLVFILISISTFVTAQNNKYWVFFKDKKGCTFNPFDYFDQKAIERRINQAIPLSDSTDFPVNENYIQLVCSEVDSVSYSTRWFNALSVYANEIQIENVKKLSFVSSVEEMNMIAIPAEFDGDYDTSKITSYQLNVLKNQTERLGASFFIKNNIDGKGIRIAIFDGGFPSVDKSPAFEHIRRENRIIKTYDFAKKNDFVYSYLTHGTMVMSCIAGMVQGQKIGMATGAEFLLARTEIRREPFSEEENWLAAVEWADKNGANIINSSLGYTFHRYFPEQMDGKSTLVVRAAEMAAKKGILVVNAAGNDGDNNWKHMGTPADGDSVLSVGGIDSDSDLHTAFSSFGPTADKRLKPNVCAFGNVTAAGPKGLTTTQGTSFSSPLVAGFAACAWQTNRNWKNMELFSEIEKSADLYPYFDYAHGYGVPQAEYFTNKTRVEAKPSFDFVKTTTTLSVLIRPEFLDTTANSFNRSKSYLYYNIQSTTGVLEKYVVIAVNQKDILEFLFTDYTKGKKLNVHYKNYTLSHQF